MLEPTLIVRDNVVKYTGDDLRLVFVKVETITPSCFLRNRLGPRVRLACSVIVGVFRRFLQWVNKDTTLIYHIVIQLIAYAIAFTIDDSALKPYCESLIMLLEIMQFN